MELTKKEWEILLNFVRTDLAECKTDLKKGQFPFEQKALKKEISELQVLEKKIKKHIPNDIPCDHNWVEWENHYCNVSLRCSKCKTVFNKFKELGD